LKSKLASAFTIILAVIGAWITVELSQLINRDERERAFLESVIQGGYSNLSGDLPPSIAHISHPVSFNSVTEHRYDYTGDGNYDAWTVLVRENTPFELYYGLDDTDADGIPDKLNISTRDLQTLYGLRDITDSGTASYQSFRMSDVNNPKKHYTYFDLNADGIIDLYESSLSPRTKFILLDNAWHETLADRPGNHQDGYWIEYGDSPRKVVFDVRSGQWKPVSG